MVLLALARAAGWQTAKVPYEDLVLQAWHDFPQQFSLRNHPEHPDASDIHKRLYQSLKQAGHIVVLGNKFFRPTTDGIARARALDAALKGLEIPHESERLSREDQRVLEHALASRAFATWSAKDSDKLIDYDARMFFQFSTGTPVDERRRRVESSLRALKKAERLHIPDAADLLALGNYLASQFGNLLSEGH
jgi:hypothetical protein